MSFKNLVRLLLALGCAGLGNFGIGSPRQMPPILAVLRYMFACLNPFGYGYEKNPGRKKTRQALAKNCFRTLRVLVHPDQILLLEGSKPALRYVLEALGKVGKVVLPMPFYPGNKGGVIRAGCQPHCIPMPTVKDYIINLTVELENGLRPVAVVLSFDNPRWLKRCKDDYVQLVTLAQRYNFILISDEAYRDLAFDGKVWSVMQASGWEQVAVCIQTASKPFCAAGWKLGAVISRPDLEWQERLLEARSADSEGGSPAAQKAYEVALRCDWYPRRLAQMYRRRALYTIELFQTVGLTQVPMPYGGMFLYFVTTGEHTSDFVSQLKELGFEVSPGSKFGEPDKIRWCLNQPDWVTRRAVKAVGELVRQKSNAPIHTLADVL